MERTFASGQFERERRDIVKDFEEDPETTARTFYSIVRGKLYSPYFRLTRRELCSLPDSKWLGGGKHGSVFEAGQKYVVKQRQVSKPYVYYLALGETARRKVAPFRSQCGFPAEFPHFGIGSDDFTNEVLISYLLDEIIESVRGQGLNNVAKTFSATICDGKGLILMERGKTSLDQTLDSAFVPYQEVGFTSQGKIPIFTEGFILDVLGQLILVLQFLHNWNFVHGDLKLGNIAFFDEPYLYFESDFTVKLIDFEKASLTFVLQNTDHRFFNYSSLANTYLTFAPFQPDVKNGTFTVDKTFVSQVYAYARHDMLPYYSSFDVYTLVVSMLLSPSYFFSFARYPRLISKILQVMFDEETLTIVYGRLYSAQGKVDPNSMSSILEIIKDVPLKCNVANLLQESIFL